jgi:CNT family concentrative nucleoside transporter
MLERFMPLVGMAFMVALCLAISHDRRAAVRRWSLIAWGLGLQFIVAVIILRTGIGRAFFQFFNDVFVAVIACTEAGASFLFGPKLTNPMEGLGYFAFVVLSTIIFFSALSAVLYQMGALQVVVKAVAWVMEKTMKTSGAETLSASANIFLGQTEAPLLVRPFIDKMTRSELMTVMTGGFATVAGSVMAAYIFFLGDVIPNVAGHLLAASVMSAPAALMFGKLVVPETDTPETLGNVNLEMPAVYDGVVDAAAGGASEGVKLALNVGGMLIAFLALLALVNLLLSVLGGAVMMPFTDGGFALQQTWTLESILGYICAPFAFLLGVPWSDCMKAGELMGIKTVANEFVAYTQLQEMAWELTPRTRLILAYALCGFANLGSIGIQIGGLTIMAPNRRADLAKLGFPALIAGTFAAFSPACVAGVLYVGDPTPVSVRAAVSEDGSAVVVRWQNDGTPDAMVVVTRGGETIGTFPAVDGAKTVSIPAATFDAGAEHTITVRATPEAGEPALDGKPLAFTLPAAG